MFDLNCDAKHLVFVVNSNNLYAKHRNEETGRMEPITREAFAKIVEDVKTQCSGFLALSTQSIWLFAFKGYMHAYPNYIVMLL